MPAPELGSIGICAFAEMQSHTPVGSHFTSRFLRAGKIGHHGGQKENFGKLTPCPVVLVQFQAPLKPLSTLIDGSQRERPGGLIANNS